MKYANPMQEKLRRLNENLMKEHHSTGDWDFENANWGLDTTNYISPPSSMYIYAGNWAKPKTTVVPPSSVKEGQVITWFRNNNLVYDNCPAVRFRWQNHNNFYECEARTGLNQQSIRRVYNGNLTILSSATKNWVGRNQWGKIRITWWNDYVGLVIRFEYWDGSNWQYLCPEAYDANNYWKDVGGRICLGSNYTSTISWDDTEIYGVP